MNYNHIEDFYTNGDYLKNNPTWDKEDSSWKSEKLSVILEKNNINNLKTVSEVGCGAGMVIYNLSKKIKADNYYGYDISKDAIYMCEELKREQELNNFTFITKDIPDQVSDLVLCIDVFEHIDNEFEFLKRLKETGEYKIFNIPLDLSVQSIIREDAILKQRRQVGHINYYTKNLALETLKDTGYEIIDYAYAPWYTFYTENKLSTRLINIARNILMKHSPDFCVKFLGGSSLIVLTK